MDFQLRKWTGLGARRSELYTNYDSDADFLLARFGTPTEADTVVADGDVAVRLSRETGEPVGIEVVDCAAKFQMDPSTITAAFARELLARYGWKARTILNDRRGTFTESERVQRTR